METYRTPQKISRSGVDGNTQFNSVIGVSSTPDPSVMSGTRIDGTYAPTCVISGTSVVSGTNAAQPSGGPWSPRIGNIR